jgi:hypothetical protein
MTRKKIISHLRRVCLHLHFMVNYTEYARILIFVYHCGGPGFAPGSVHLGFVVDEVALGQGFFFRVLRFTPVSIIPSGLHTYISSAG